MAQTQTSQTPFLLTLRCNACQKHAVAQVHFAASAGFLRIDRCRMCLKPSGWRVVNFGLEPVDPASPGPSRIQLSLRCAHCRQALGAVHFAEPHGLIKVLCCASCKGDTLFRCGSDGVTGEALAPVEPEPPGSPGA